MATLPIIFMGTPELAGESLRALLRAPEFRVVAVVTQPDQPKGRGLKLQPSPVKEIALQASLPVLQPERARDESFLQELRKLQPELIAVAAYGQLLPKGILDLPRFGCLNVHTSLLPKYRGAAPIQHAILNGDAATGVTIMKMDAGLDTGDIVAQEATPIHADDNSQTLHDRLAQLGAALLVKTIPGYVSGSLHPRPQPAEGVSHAAKIRKQDGHIDWRQPARAIWNRVRAFTPWPGAFTHWLGVPPSGGKAAAPPDPSSVAALRRVEGGTPNPGGHAESSHGQLLKIWQAELLEPSGPPGTILQADKTGIVVGCGTGSLRILVLQREGGRRMNAQEFLAGHPLPAGQMLG